MFPRSLNIVKTLSYINHLSDRGNENKDQLNLIDCCCTFPVHVLSKPKTMLFHIIQLLFSLNWILYVGLLWLDFLLITAIANLWLTEVGRDLTTSVCQLILYIWTIVIVIMWLDPNNHTYMWTLNETLFYTFSVFNGKVEFRYQIYVLFFFFNIISMA